MAAPASLSNSLAADVKSLDKLRFGAGGDARGSIKEAAKQLESLFMREMIKSMREATLKSGMLEGAQGNLGNDLLDQQLSVQMAGLPGGLSEAIERQLAKQMGGTEASGAIGKAGAPQARTTISAPGGGFGSAVVGDGSGIFATSNAGLTTPTTDNYISSQGTSLAAPQVAGVAALLFQVNPNLSPDAVALALTSTARPHPLGTYCASRTTCGAGLLDAQRGRGAGPSEQQQGVRR